MAKKWKNGTCAKCGFNGAVTLIEEWLDTYYEYFEKRNDNNEIVYLCAQCQGKLAFKYYKINLSKPRLIHSTSTLNTTSTISTSDISRSLENSKTYTSNSSSSAPVEVFPCSYSESLNRNKTNVVNESSSINSNEGGKKTNRPAPLSIKRKREEKAKTREQEAREQKAAARQEQAAQVQQQERREVAIHEISSGEDTDDTFDPEVRYPNIQPLIRKRRAPLPIPLFNDHNAPIFDTSLITGGHHTRSRHLIRIFF